MSARMDLDTIGGMNGLLTAPLAPRMWQDLAAPVIGRPRGVAWLLPGVLALALLAFLAFNTARNLGYPLWNPRPEDWGGPSLAGRWLVHGVGWLPFLYLGLVIVAWLAGWQRRLMGR